MEEVEKLLKSMRSLIQLAGAISTELTNFIRAESLPLGEVVSDWLEVVMNPLPSSCGQPYISEQAAELLIERRRAETWAKAKQKFAPQELGILTDWQRLEARALTLSINMILEKYLVYYKGKLAGSSGAYDGLVKTYGRRCRRP
ncbi:MULTISPECIES: hypothetical protein [unclassified Microbulbifer]|uniref:hypothetical protein n=1 Tax=unclassified Microbulbifer TaxID=2619833 RepID=UPI0027E50F27|nr:MULTISPECIES: hypothetical protein [unclassified Microbulbifer]